MKTAEELGITQPELDALIWVRDGLGNGTFTHADDENTREFNENNRTGNYFNMNLTCHVNNGGCGTVGCIGGWMWLHMHRDEVLIVDDVFKPTKKQNVAALDYIGEHERLARLFYPRNREDWHLLTARDTVDAIDNFLNTGNPEWPDDYSDDE